MTDSYKYRTNLLHVREVVELSALLRGGGFICISHGFDYCSLGLEARSLLLFVLVQRLIKNTEGHFLN